MRGPWFQSYPDEEYTASVILQKKIYFACKYFIAYPIAALAFCSYVIACILLLTFLVWLLITPTDSENYAERLQSHPRIILIVTLVITPIVPAYYHIWKNLDWSHLTWGRGRGVHCRVAIHALYTLAYFGIGFPHGWYLAYCWSLQQYQHDVKNMLKQISNVGVT
jgi:hypothetical protein